jgi:hypothetical protein
MSGHVLLLPTNLTPDKIQACICWLGVRGDATVTWICIPIYRVFQNNVPVRWTRGFEARNCIDPCPQECYRDIKTPDPVEMVLPAAAAAENKTHRAL